jgi:hypothetical protein
LLQFRQAFKGAFIDAIEKYQSRVGILIGAQAISEKEFGLDFFCGKFVRGFISAI